jgi:hypothetical protein
MKTTSREGLRPLEVFVFDDVRTDFRTLVPGYASPVELNLLIVLDVATGEQINAIEKLQMLQKELPLKFSTPQNSRSKGNSQ